MAAGFVRPPAGHEHLLEVRFRAPQPAPPPLEELLPGWRRLAHRLFEELMSRGIGLSEIRSGIAPGRAALAIFGLPEAEPEKERLRLGPLVKGALEDGRPSAELVAFAREEGRAVAALDRVYTERGHRFAALELLPGRPVGQAVAELLAEILGELRLARRGPGLPEIAGLLSLASGAPAPFEVEGTLAGGETEVPGVAGAAGGEPFRPASAEDYFRELPRRGVPLESLGRLQEKLLAGRT